MRLKINSEICTGCQCCALACSVRHFDEFNPARSCIVVKNDSYHGSSKIVTCRNCKNPKCIEACTYGAFTRDKATGHVKIDYNLCQDCRACIDACPFGAVRLDPEKFQPFVCDFCSGNPACVNYCYPAALQLIND